MRDFTKKRMDEDCKRCTNIRFIGGDYYTRDRDFRL